MVGDQAGMSNPPSFLVPKQSASFGVTPRKCSVALKYALPPPRTNQQLRPSSPIKAAGPRYRVRIAVSARLPG